MLLNACTDKHPHTCLVPGSCVPWAALHPAAPASSDDGWRARWPQKETRPVRFCIVRFDVRFPWRRDAPPGQPSSSCLGAGFRWGEKLANLTNFSNRNFSGGWFLSPEKRGKSEKTCIVRFRFVYLISFWCQIIFGKLGCFRRQRCICNLNQAWARKGEGFKWNNYV